MLLLSQACSSSFDGEGSGALGATEEYATDDGRDNESLLARPRQPMQPAARAARQKKRQENKQTMQSAPITDTAAAATSTCDGITDSLADAVDASDAHDKTPSSDLLPFGARVVVGSESHDGQLTQKAHGPTPPLLPPP